jgi:hypothetical protein
MFPEKLVWGLFAAFSFIFFMYTPDIISTADNGVLLIEAISKGEFLNYYQYSLDHAITEFPANYELPIFVIFGIWNLPLFIAKNFFAANIFSFAGMLWAKSILIVFTIGNLHYLRKICEDLKITGENAALAAFLFLTSCMVLVHVTALAFYDIISLFFMIAGLHYYLAGDKKRFVLFFAIAIPLKMFALFIFVPLLVLSEKRLTKIALFLIAGCSILIISKLLFMGNSAYEFSVAGTQSEFFMPRLIYGVFALWPNSRVSIFLLGFFLLTIFCYVKRFPTTAQRNKFSVYLCLAVFTLFITTIIIHPQWAILLTPFVILVMMQNPEKWKINLLLDIGMTAGFLTQATYSWGHVYSKDSLQLARYLGIVSDTPRYDSFGTFVIERLESESVYPFAYALFISCALAFVAINFPKDCFRTNAIANTNTGAENRSLFRIRTARGLIWIRALISYGFLLALFFICGTSI